MGVRNKVQMLIPVIALCYMSGIRCATLKCNSRNIKICDDSENCKTFNQEQLNRAYAGRFTDVSEHVQATGINFTEIDDIDAKIHVPELRCDCCITDLYCTYYNQRVNTAGELCFIIQLPYLDIFQHQTIGLCRDNNACIGGFCRQAHAWITLLAWCPSFGLKLTFSVFVIPSFCDCK